MRDDHYSVMWLTKMMEWNACRMLVGLWVTVLVGAACSPTEPAVVPATEPTDDRYMSETVPADTTGSIDSDETLTNTGEIRLSTASTAVVNAAGDALIFSMEDGAVWEIVISGVVKGEESAVYAYTDLLVTVEASCWTVLGTITPSYLARGLVSAESDIPSVGLRGFLGDEPVEFIPDDGEWNGETYGCIDFDLFDNLMDNLGDAGYSGLGGAAVTVGTGYAFFATFLIPRTRRAVPDGVVIGDPGSGQFIEVEAGILEEIPVPRLQTGTPVVDSQVVQPIRREGSEFSYTYLNTSSDRVEWDGLLLGVVEGPVSKRHDGRCLAVVGMLTPKHIDGRVLPLPEAVPSISLIESGHLRHRPTICGTYGLDLREFGYGHIGYAQTTVGTVYPFYVWSELSEVDPGKLVVVVDPFGDQTVFFEPILLTSVPEYDNQLYGPSVSTYRHLKPMSDPHRSGFSYRFSADYKQRMSWEGYLIGIVETDRLPDTEPGRCLVLLGTLTPKEYGYVQTVEGIPLWPVPPIELIVDGGPAPAGYGCDTSGPSGSGYRYSGADGGYEEWWTSLVSDTRHIELGYPYPFQKAFFVPDERPGRVEAIVIDPGSGQEVLYRPTILAETPHPPWLPPPQFFYSRQPDQMGDPHKSFRLRTAETIWEGTFHGVKDTRLGTNDTATRCLALMGSLTATRAADIPPPIESRSVMVVAGGRLLQHDRHACTSLEVEHAGYGDLRDAPTSSPRGSTYAFYAGFLVPATDSLPEWVAVGNPWAYEWSYIYEPLILDTIPDSAGTYRAASTRSAQATVPTPAIWTNFAGSDCADSIDIPSWH